MDNPGILMAQMGSWPPINNLDLRLLRLFWDVEFAVNNIVLIQLLPLVRFYSVLSLLNFFLRHSEISQNRIELVRVQIPMSLVLQLIQLFFLSLVCSRQVVHMHIPLNVHISNSR